MTDETPDSPASELVESARSGSREAFETLVQCHRGVLEAHVRRRVGSHLRSLIDIEDVVQETLVEAWASIGRFEWRGEGSFVRWLRRIAELRVLRVASRKRPERELLVPDAEPAPVEVSPSRGLRRNERFDRLQRALDELPSDYREVVVLARIEGRKLQEIADRMGRSLYSVTHLLSRALDKLKDSFGDTDSFHLPPRRLNTNKGVDSGPDDSEPEGGARAREA